MPKPACVYCPRGVGTTRDHVPPKGFFQDPIPSDSQLITVPCCESCRKKDHANDELIRNVIVSLADIEPLDYVSKHVVPRRDRAMAKSPSKIAKMMELMHRVRLTNAQGEVVGEDWAFSLNHPSMDQFLERVGRALIFREFGRRYFRAKFGWVLNPPIPPEAYQFAVANYPKRRVLDVIAYVVSPVKDIHWIILQFYGGVEFLLRFEKKRTGRAVLFMAAFILAVAIAYFLIRKS